MRIKHSNRQISKTLIVIVLTSMMLFSISGLSVKGQNRTWQVPQDYPTIDEAIIASIEGDTIQVSAGTYTGFTVDKALKIVGVANNETVITSFITISASNVTLNHLLVDTGEWGDWGIYGSGGNCEISENVILGNSGISLNGNNNSVIENRLNVRFTGLSIKGENNQVTDNEVVKSRYGLFIEGGNNVFSDNVFNSYEDFWSEPSGVKFSSSNGGNLISNNVIKSGGYGVFLESGRGNYGPDAISSNTIIAKNGIKTSQVDACTITYNDITVEHTALDSDNSDNFEILNNVLMNNFTYIIDNRGCNNFTIRDNVIACNDGLELYSCIGYSISNNEIESTRKAITLTSRCAEIEIICNDITGQSPASIEGISCGGTENTLIHGNTISNFQFGLIVSESAEGCSVHYNNFVGNEIQASDDSGAIWHLNMTGNYWDDWTTPDVNSDGIVDNPYVITGDARSVDRYPLTSLVNSFIIPEFPSLIVLPSCLMVALLIMLIRRSISSKQR